MEGCYVGLEWLAGFVTWTEHLLVTDYLTCKNRHELAQVGIQDRQTLGRDGLLTRSPDRETLLGSQLLCITNCERVITLRFSHNTHYALRITQYARYAQYQEFPGHWRHTMQGSREQKAPEEAGTRACFLSRCPLPTDSF